MLERFQFVLVFSTIILSFVASRPRAEGADPTRAKKLTVEEAAWKVSETDQVTELS